MNLLALLHLWILFSFFLWTISLVIIRVKILFKHQRTVMYQKEEISLLEKKTKSSANATWVFQVVPAALCCCQCSSSHCFFISIPRFYEEMKHSSFPQTALGLQISLSLPLTSPFLPPPFSPAAFVQPDNPLLNPREHILGTGTIKKKETN